ncbi:MAG TPA: hypothetical protein VIW03_14390 [Anaeromyxobacter sp.]
MTAGERRLVALAALFAPGRAHALLARVTGPAAAAGVEDAARLAASPRRERLGALAAAIAMEAGPSRASAEAAAALERPRVAAVLRSLTSRTTAAGASAPLVRLCRERIGR